MTLVHGFWPTTSAMRGPFLGRILLLRCGYLLEAPWLGACAWLGCRTTPDTLPAFGLTESLRGLLFVFEHGFRWFITCLDWGMRREVHFWSCGGGRLGIRGNWIPACDVGRRNGVIALNVTAREVMCGRRWRCGKSSEGSWAMPTFKLYFFSQMFPGHLTSQ